MSRGPGSSTLTTYRLRLQLLLLLVSFAASAAGFHQAHAVPLEQSDSIVLGTGDWLSVAANRPALQLVNIHGNMSAAEFVSPTAYPGTNFNLTSGAPASYSVQLMFSYESEYTVTVSVITAEGKAIEKPSYYVSSGELMLTINADFKRRDPLVSTSDLSVWDSFSDWTARFGDAFPLWVKLLYVLLGVQFAAVGYKWIEFENARREEDAPLSKFDRGNLLYLWSDILFKFLLTVLLIIAVAMGGQIVLLTILNFMFLAPVSMLSLWDIFVLGFAAGITTIAYFLKFLLGRSLDFKPLFQE